MPSDRTFVTELSTALGATGAPLEQLMGALVPPPAFSDLAPEEWTRLVRLFLDGAHSEEFRQGWANGRAFLLADDALAGRRPRRVEWTGGRRPPGDEVVPADLRIDHVYLVSCKYQSRILHNPSPARLVEGLLSNAPVGDARDWYARIAPEEYQELYEACLDSSGGAGLPMFAMSLNPAQRRQLSARLTAGWPSGAERAYGRLCRAVAERTADAWRRNIAHSSAEIVLWRLLRIGSVPYFVLGSGAAGPVRLRIDTPWDWRRSFRLRRLEVEAEQGGQPRIAWSALCERRRGDGEQVVQGHVEIRWSHGRFRQPPEAKVYLDSAHERVPGYHLL